jgi:GH24 family phage-related lysozyme (muramidase)
MKYATGAIQSTLDNRNIFYSELPQAQNIQNIPSSYKTDISMFPVQNQQNIGACVAFSLAFILQYNEYKENGVIKNMSQRFIYSLGRAINGLTGKKEQGLMPLYGLKALSSGTLDNNYFDDITLDHADYEKMAITEQIKQEAYKYRIKGFAQVLELFSLQKAIMEDGLVAISLPFGNSNFEKSLLTPYVSTESRHYVVAYGWETVKNRVKILFRNHWTSNWGENGNGSFYWDEYKTQVIDMFAVTDIPNSFIESARATAYIFTNDIKKGARGSEVVELQKVLFDLGYFNLESTGFYGEKTAQAITSFQSNHGIKTNYGKVFGPQTRAKMNEVLSLFKKKNDYKNISELGKKMIKQFEGIHDGMKKTEILEPKKDPIGLYTLGWGARYDKEKKEVTEKTKPITMAEADELFDRDIKRFVSIVNYRVPNCNQNEFDALVSFCYNQGNLWSLPKRIKEGSLKKENWLKYCIADGKPILLTRRQKEWDYYCNGKTSSLSSASLVELTQSKNALNIMESFTAHLLSDSRLKSLLWRACMMGLAFIVNASLNNLTALKLTPEVTVFVGLVLGEISKALSKYRSQETDQG